MKIGRFEPGRFVIAPVQRDNDGFFVRYSDDGREQDIRLTRNHVCNGTQLINGVRFVLALASHFPVSGKGDAIIPVPSTGRPGNTFYFDAQDAFDVTLKDDRVEADFVSITYAEPGELSLVELAA